MRTGPLLMGRHLVGVPAAAALLVIVALLSLRYGALDIDTATVWNALWDYDRGDHAQIVVRELRLHRTIIGMIAGASFAVAGALTQGVTRNPLGAPGILGTNAGAAFAVVTAIYVAGIATPTGYVWFAFAGALGATVLVYAIASAGAGGASPVKLALAGAVVTALLGSWTAGLLFFCQGMVPLEAYPGWAQRFVRFNPATAYVTALDRLARGGELTVPIGTAVAWSVGIIAVFGWFASRAIRRPRR